MGIGAVFTAESARGRGYASELVRSVLAEAREEGCHAGCLFSDIGAALYQRLGFIEQPAWRYEAEVARLPLHGDPLSSSVVNGLAELVSLHRASASEGWLRVLHDDASARNWDGGNGAAHTMLLCDDGRPVGYLVAFANGDTLWIDELCAPEQGDERLWSAVRQQAEEHRTHARRRLAA